MKYFLVFFIFVTSSVFSCEITLPSQLLFLGDDHSNESTLKVKDCSPTAAREVNETLLSLDGNISATQLNEIMTQKGFPGISFHPTRVRIQQLKNIIRERIQMPAGVHVKKTRAVNTDNFISLNSGDQIEIECSSCLFGNQQNITIFIKGFDGTSRTVMASVDFKRMVKAFRLNQAISSFTEIQNKDLLKEEYVELIPHTDLMLDFDSLRFYKTNKPLKMGELLKKSDLNAINLVRAGLKTEVILENTSIRIKTEAISRSNGSVGELVEVYHPQKNKKYIGKVIDLNKVLVEL